MNIIREYQEKSHLFLQQQWFTDDAPAEQSVGAPGVCLLPSERGTWNGITHSDIAEHLEFVLVPITCAGMNPYKIVEMWKNYRPNVPIEYHLDDLLYAEPSEEVWAKVKMEKTDRSQFWATLKVKKYAENKERIKRVAFKFKDGEGKV